MQGSGNGCVRVSGNVHNRARAIVHVGKCDWLCDSECARLCKSRQRMGKYELSVSVRSVCVQSWVSTIVPAGETE